MELKYAGAAEDFRKHELLIVPYGIEIKDW